MQFPCFRALPIHTMPRDPPNRLVVIHSLAGLAHCPRGADLRKLSLRLRVVVGIASAPTRLQKNLMSLQDAPKSHRLAGMHVIPIHHNRKTLLLPGALSHPTTNCIAGPMRIANCASAGADAGSLQTCSFHSGTRSGSIALSLTTSVATSVNSLQMFDMWRKRAGRGTQLGLEREIVKDNGAHGTPWDISHRVALQTRPLWLIRINIRLTYNLLLLSTSSLLRDNKRT